MIDTHAHLSKRLTESFELPHINKVILAASCLADSEENIQLASQYPGKLYAAVGIHPQEDLSFQMSDLKTLANKAVAIGECGLDFSQNFDQAAQEKAFRQQIELAQEKKLPLIIHARKAVDETIEVLSDYNNLAGVFHCYSGGKKRVNKVVELGTNWYFGFDGNLTYEIGLAEVVKNIPKDRIVLETDSPFLTPIPHRGETNKPDYVKFVYQKLAQIWELPIEKTEEIVDQNAKRLFQIV